MAGSRWGDDDVPGERFTFFWKGRFSQWEASPFDVGGTRFLHAEQYMMYAKALLFGDHAAANRILEAVEPAEVKLIGRGVSGFEPRIWEMFREGVVLTGSLAKYTQNRELRDALMATRGTTLVEASPFDTVWGIGLAEEDPRARDRAQWRGMNLLGRILTRVREALAYEASA